MSKISPIKEKILRFIDIKGISKYQFYRDTGIARSTLDKDSGISEENIAKFIAQYPEVNVEWLFLDKGEIFRCSTDVQIPKENGPKNSHLNGHLFDKIEDKTESHAVLRKELYQDEQNIELLALQAEKGIPLIPDYAFAGFAPGSETQILELNCEKYVIPHFKGADGLIHVKGSSMYPKYNSGDIVAFKKLSMGTFFQWNKVYIIDTEQGLLIKRVQQADDDEHVLLVSENPSYKPFPLPLTDIYSLAIVVGVIRLE